MRQTGSGKTYTMSGPSERPRAGPGPSEPEALMAAQGRGMIPRAVEMIFREKVSSLICWSSLIRYPVLVEMMFREKVRVPSTGGDDVPGEGTRGGGVRGA